jgi:histidinol-phosphate aminotransferase
MGGRGEVTPYQPGMPVATVARRTGLPPGAIVKLASNENPFGASPMARSVLREPRDLERYPDNDVYELRAAVASALEVEPGNVHVGNGSNAILDLVARCFLSSGGSAVYDEHGFIEFRLLTALAGGVGLPARSVEFGHSPENLLAALRPDTRVMFVANPNNPTGSFLPTSQIVELIARTPRDVLLVLDEAYTEYLEPEERLSPADLIAAHPNVLVVRTFSKAHGLAGLRVGYAVGHTDLIGFLGRSKLAFAVSTLAQRAAIAALQDHEFLEKTREMNRHGRIVLEQGLAEVGLEQIPSRGNFIAFRAPEAARVHQAMLERGVIVRPLAAYGMTDWIRVSVGLANQNYRFLAVLREALGAAS